MIKGRGSEINTKGSIINFSFRKKNKNKTGWEIIWSNHNPDIHKVKLASLLTTIALLLKFSLAFPNQYM